MRTTDQSVSLARKFVTITRGVPQNCGAHSPLLSFFGGPTIFHMTEHIVPKYIRNFNWNLFEKNFFSFVSLMCWSCFVPVFYRYAFFKWKITTFKTKYAIRLLDIDHVLIYLVFCIWFLCASVLYYLRSCSLKYGGVVDQCYVYASRDKLLLIKRTSLPLNNSPLRV